MSLCLDGILHQRVLFIFVVPSQLSAQEHGNFFNFKLPLFGHLFASLGLLIAELLSFKDIDHDYIVLWENQEEGD